MLIKSIPKVMLGAGRKLLTWFDNSAVTQEAHDQQIDWWRILPFVMMHIACIAVIWVGWSTFSILFAVVLYVVRMFAITGFYHRYFSHKTFQTSRFCQFLFALLASTAVQRGPLWWAAHHRTHHMHSDDVRDVHSPHQQGFFWSHIGWFLAKANFVTHLDRVKELAKFPELQFLDRFDSLIPIVFAVIIFILGESLAHYAPHLGTDGWQLLLWGFVISTVALYHATFTVNSVAHVWGSRRYATRDQSRNNFLIAIVTLGEGWHNNHHHYPGSARQGFYWWEIDLTYYGLKCLSALGLIWNLKRIPVELRDVHLKQSKIASSK